MIWGVARTIEGLTEELERLKHSENKGSAVNGLEHWIGWAKAQLTTLSEVNEKLKSENEALYKIIQIMIK